MMSSKKSNLSKTVLSAAFVALAIVLPFLTGQLPQLGNALCPMHIPVILCGFLCGAAYGAAVGFVAPILRFAIFGMPPIMPVGISMCFELAAYAAVSGVMYKILPDKKVYVYVSLVTAMLSGRAVWGAVRFILYGLGKSDFGWSAFLSGAFLSAVPGIIIQLVLIPVLVITLKRYMAREREN